MSTLVGRFQLCAHPGGPSWNPAPLSCFRNNFLCRIGNHWVPVSSGDPLQNSGTSALFPKSLLSPRENGALHPHKGLSKIPWSFCPVTAVAFAYSCPAAGWSCADYAIPSFPPSAQSFPSTHATFPLVLSAAGCSTTAAKQPLFESES